MKIYVVRNKKTGVTKGHTEAAYENSPENKDWECIEIVDD